MGIVSDLLGLIRAQDPTTTVVDIQTALDALGDERENAHTRLAALAEKRRAALMSDADASAIAKFDHEADAARLLVERLDLLEPELISKLQHARGDARRQEWKERYRLYHESALAYATALRAAVAALDRLVETSDSARAAGFEAEWRSCFVSPPLLLSKDNVEQFLVNQERTNDAELARQQGRNILPMVAPPAPQKRPLPAPAKPAEPAPRPQRTPIRQTAGPDEILIRIIRPGYELPAGLQCGIGDVVALPEDLARRVVENGAADLEIGEAAQ